MKAIRNRQTPETSRPFDASAQTMLRYDGSFEGYLCAVAEALNASRAGSPLPAIRGPEARAELFDESLAVKTDVARARRLWARVASKAGEEALLACRDAFCSDFTAKEDPIARLMARLSLEGAGALDDLATPDPCFVSKASLRTRYQAHAITGLLRFSELKDGSWYAAIEPDCDILPLIGDHFAARYPDMSFAIHDGKRGKALLHRPGLPWRIVEGFSLVAGEDERGPNRQESSSVAPLPGPETEPPYSEGELAVRAGWFRYFEAVAIQQRKNPRLQAGHMPKKYWRFLPETRPREIE